LQFLDARPFDGIAKGLQAPQIKRRHFMNINAATDGMGQKICVLMFSLIKGHRHLSTFKRLTLRRRLSILRRGVFRHKRVYFWTAHIGKGYIPFHSRLRR